MEDSTLVETAVALGRDWELSLPDTISEETILSLLAQRIVVLIERGADTFYQLMYRLDISEKKLNAVLGEDDVPAHIARLIYDRQLQKIKSRAEHKKADFATDDDIDMRL